jgi:hypothetical protein
MELSAATLVIPVIVSNAPLYTAEYDPTAVSLDTGEFRAPPEHVTNPGTAAISPGGHAAIVAPG